jgi:hypothetical protein
MIKPQVWLKDAKFDGFSLQTIGSLRILLVITGSKDEIIMNIYFPLKRTALQQ